MQVSPGVGALQTDTLLPGLCHHPTQAHSPAPLSARHVGIPANVPLLDGCVQRAGRGCLGSGLALASPERYPVEPWSGLGRAGQERLAPAPCPLLPGLGVDWGGVVA